MYGTVCYVLTLNKQATFAVCWRDEDFWMRNVPVILFLMENVFMCHMSPCKLE